MVTARISEILNNDSLMVYLQCELLHYIVQFLANAFLVYRRKLFVYLFISSMTVHEHIYDKCISYENVNDSPP